MGGMQLAVDMVGSASAGGAGMAMKAGGGGRAPLSLNLDSRSLSMLCRLIIKLIANEAIAAPVIVQ